MIKDLFKKIKLVFKSVREYKKYAFVTPLFMVGEAGAETAIPFLMSLLIEDIQAGVITSNDYSKLWMYVGLMLGLAIFSILCGIFGGIFAAKASAGLAKNLRHDLYSKLQSFSFANIDKFESSSLITRMTTDIQNATMAFQMLIRIVVRAPLLLVFSMVMAFIAGGPLAWVFVVLAPIVIVSFILIARFALPTFRKVFKRYDKLNQTVQENISGIRVVKSYVREEYEQKKFNKASSDIAKDFIKAETIVALNQPIMNTAIHISNIALLMIASWLVLQNSEYIANTDTIIYHSVSPSEMSACITYGIQILMALMMITMIAVMMIFSLESIRRIGEVLEERPTIKNPINPVMEVKDGSVSFKNVNFKYSKNAERDALENINIEIKSGQFVGILGSTGSGKTSLVNLISRLYDVTEGELLVGGINVKDYDLITLRDAVAVVLQKNVLFSGTIASNLRWGNENATDEELQKACKIACADEFIETLPDKYETKIEQGGTNVSGGQKQRLCIARAILKRPKILILDDSTSAVDTKTDAIIRKGLKEDIPETTKIVVAQRISSIQDADQIIVMNNGMVDAIGNHETLIKTNEIYREVFESQTKKGGK
ncbi:MAG: ABC transporter ATP-binding protein [Erysipelotrichaceae bacterium]|nr:ABC transporter ATP-binding protein [Erysipelotrichaceae bacterium]